MLSGTDSSDKRTVGSRNICRQSVCCAVEIQHHFIVADIDFFTSVECASCCNYKILRCCFGCRYSHFRHFPCGSGAGSSVAACAAACIGSRISAGTGSCIGASAAACTSACAGCFPDIYGSVGVIPCDINFPIFVACFAVDLEYYRMGIADSIDLFCCFVPCDGTTKLLTDTAHRQHGSAVNAHRRHIGVCIFFSINNDGDLFGVIGMMCAIIKQVHLDIGGKCRRRV